MRRHRTSLPPHPFTQARSEQTAADIQQSAPLYTTKASKRPQTSSKVHPLHDQSEQIAADIQQSAPSTAAKTSDLPQTSVKVRAYAGTALTPAAPLYRRQSERLAADICQSAPLYTTKVSKRPQTSSKVRLLAA